MEICAVEYSAPLAVVEVAVAECCAVLEQSVAAALLGSIAGLVSEVEEEEEPAMRAEEGEARITEAKVYG
jgi:hypothetical protein